MMGFNYSDGERLDAAVDELEKRGVTVEDKDEHGYLILKENNKNINISQQIRCLLIDGLACSHRSKNGRTVEVRMRTPNKIST